MNNERIDRTGEVEINNQGCKMKIIKYRNARDIDIIFEYPYQCILQHREYRRFIQGYIKNPMFPFVYGCGYLGMGKYKANIYNKNTSEYDRWHSMLHRCYDNKYFNKHLTYQNCMVCDEWLNFQTFAKWYDKNYYQIKDQEMQLDKDILHKGNKIYSPENCVFVPQEINKLFTKNDINRGDYPIGVFYNENKNKYVSRINLLNQYNKKKNKIIGLYSTSEEAFNAYKIEKEQYIKQVADKYKNRIPEKLYTAMYTYNVEITD